MEVTSIQKLRDEINERFACAHPKAKLRVKVASNGARHYRVQCLRCGEGRQASNSEKSLASQAEPFDDALRDEWSRAKSEAYTHAWEVESRAKKKAWLDDYSELLNSAEWAAKRKLALERDGHRCQAQLPGCRTAATEVHHTTYAHWWDAPLFELQSVCRQCHQQITAMDRAART